MFFQFFLLRAFSHLYSTQNYTSARKEMQVPNLGASPFNARTLQIIFLKNPPNFAKSLAMMNLFFLEKMYSKNDLRIKFYRKQKHSKRIQMRKNGNFCFFLICGQKFLPVRLNRFFSNLAHVFIDIRACPNA